MNINGYVPFLINKLDTIVSRYDANYVGTSGSIMVSKLD